MSSEQIREIMIGLQRLGLEVRESGEPESKPMFSGVWMEKGALVVHPPSAHISDLLHEAGHFAITPSRFRHLLEPGNIEEDKDNLPLRAAIEDYMRSNLDPDDPTVRGILQMSDPEAVAWSFAAAKALGIPDTFLITRGNGEPPPFEGEGEEILACLRMGRYLGIHGLQAASMCKVKEWPAMRRWIQI